MALASTSNNVNYDDQRFKEVESGKNTALKENEATYNNMINSTDKYYEQQIDAAQKYAEQQSALQQKNTDFAIEKIEQEKKQTKQDYLKEQTAAYVDYQKESNKYGVNAEQTATSGLSNSGYSESSKVAMYTAYQNRVATARDSYNRAVLNYDNSIKDAMLQNNSALAEIAYNALQTQLELSLQGFQYKNQLILSKAEQKASTEDRYYTRYQNVLSQINTENALAEEIRQFNESLAEEKRQFNETMAYNKSKSSGSSSSKSSSSSSSSGSSKINKTDGSSGNGSTSNSGVTYNTKSLTAMGLAGISEEMIDELVQAGYIKEVENGNVISWEPIKSELAIKAYVNSETAKQNIKNTLVNWQTNLRK